LIRFNYLLILSACGHSLLDIDCHFYAWCSNWNRRQD